MKLSVLVPVYNEAATVADALKRVLGVDYPCELEVVVVDDGSLDETATILAGLDDPRLKVAHHPKNSGKGAAIRTAARAATGDYMVICDADLEYSPEEIPALLAPVLAGDATVVYGTRTFGSLDETATILAGIDDPRLRVVHHPKNSGKGAAIRTAASAATGDYMVICDADLEYSPEEIPALLAPVLAGDAAVVYGTRTFGSHTAFSFWYVLGNKAVTLFANVVYNCWISDLETCFKLMPLELYREMDVRSAGFGMEAEVTAKLLIRGYRPYEVPISYKARTRAQGKKLTWRDGVEALWILSREKLRGGVRRPAVGG